MKSQMLRLGCVLFLTLTFAFTLDAQRPKVKVDVFQDGEKVKAQNGVFYIKKKPFSLRFRVKGTDGFYLNTSTAPAYYSLGSSQPLPDQEFIHFKAYAEYEGNKKRLLYVDPEGFSFLGYNVPGDYDKFNVVTPRGKGFEAYRVVQRLHFTEKDKIIELRKVTETDLYLFLIVTSGFETEPMHQELLRQKYRISWID